jgi:ubiquinone/menaquinone biosynthesis C-methylase UbiE
MEQSNDMIGKWIESAAYWEKYRETIREMFAPVTQALIEDAGMGSGHTVLDIAMGPGEPALTIADVVGAAGKVVGTDAVAEMVEAARREARRRNLCNASFEVATADHLPFLAESFDAVVSRFGVMFFPSPAGAVREMLRVLKPGGKIALAVWHFAARNPFHSAAANVVERYVESPPLAPDAPDAFRFAKPGELLRVVKDAGAMATSERLLQFSIRARMTAEEFWTLRAEMSEKFRRGIARLSQAQLEELKRDVVMAVGAYSFEGEIRFPGEVLIVNGAKAGLEIGKYT